MGKLIFKCLLCGAIVEKGGVASIHMADITPDSLTHECGNGEIGIVECIGWKPRGSDTMTDCDHDLECLPQTFRFGCYRSPDGVATTFTDYKCSKCGEIITKMGHYQHPEN